MTDQVHPVHQSKLLKKLIQFGFSEKLKAYVYGDECCRHEIDQCLLRTKKSPFYVIQDHRQADLLMISGPISKFQVPSLLQLYSEMSHPKWVIVIGSCAASGGLFAASPLVERKILEKLPVDLIVSGCPVKPQDIITATESLLEQTKQGVLPKGLL